VWLNPVAQRHWGLFEGKYPANAIIRRLFSQRMYPITIEGLESAMTEIGAVRFRARDAAQRVHWRSGALQSRGGPGCASK